MVVLAKSYVPTLFLSCSQFRLVHKDSTYFGPSLWLNAVVDKPIPEPSSGPPAAVAEHVTFEPVVLALFPPAPSSPLPPPSSPPSGEEQLTNENLLKSIGFLPASNHSSFTPECPPAVELLSASSTDKLVQTFEMIDNPSYSCGDVPRPPSDGGVVDDDGFVVIVPDCFKLDKPVPGFTPPANVQGSFDLDPSTMSCDSHVSSIPAPASTGCVHSVANQAVAPPTKVTSTSDGFEILHANIAATVSAIADASTVEDKSCEATAGGNTTPSSSPPTAKRSPGLNRSRFTLRSLKNGSCRNPIAMATGFMDAVSGFMDEKVHFALSSGCDGVTGKSEKKPSIQFASGEDSSDCSDDDEFQVSDSPL